MSRDRPPDARTRLALAARQGDTDYLIRALADPAMRRFATAYLGKLGAEAAVPQLVRNLSVENDLERNATVQALGRIGDPSAIPALLEVAREDEAVGLRTGAIEALAQLGSRHGAERLAQLAIDPAPLLAGCVRTFDVLKEGEVLQTRFPPDPEVGGKAAARASRDRRDSDLDGRPSHRGSSSPNPASTDDQIAPGLEELNEARRGPVAAPRR